MKVVIVEDEVHNSRMLTGMINSLRPDWEIIASLESVKQSVEWFTNHDHPDLIFMDIQLTDGICFSIFEKVKIESMVIFTTAYDEYAIQAFKVNSIDYLLKPIKEEQLELAIGKFENIYKNSFNGNNSDNYQSIINAIKEEKKHIEKDF